MFSSCFSQELKLNLKLSLNLLVYVNSVPGKDRVFHPEDLDQVMWISVRVCLGLVNERCLRSGSCLYLYYIGLVMNCLILLPSARNGGI